MTIYNPEGVILFWGGDYPYAEFSQWAFVPIVMGYVEYNCCEQYMMAQKALHFQDYEMFGNIMKTLNPREQKAWGRQVKGFTPEKWSEIARLVVYRGNLAKFSQHPNLYKLLMGTGQKLIVEASPQDKVWGIGLGPDDPDCLDTDKWQGTNWLGEAIMQVRTDLRTLSRYWEGK